jgi:predicted DNA binding protein
MFMQVIDAKIRVRVNSTMCRISRDYPDARMLLWCNGNHDVIQVSSGDPDSLDSVMVSLKEIGEVSELAKEKGSAVTMFRECACDGIGSYDIVEDNGCLPIGGKTFVDGWEEIRVFAPSQAALRTAISQLKMHGGEVEVASMKTRNESVALRDMGIAPVPFFGGLTEKQIEVVVSAYENGLLSVPAKSKMDQVAKKVGLSRSTYGEHLRKAMFTLVENSYPVLKLYSSSYTNPSAEIRDTDGPGSPGG